jgi:hypothetical protein
MLLHQDIPYNKSQVTSLTIRLYQLLPRLGCRYMGTTKVTETSCYLEEKVTVIVIFDFTF